MRYKCDSAPCVINFGGGRVWVKGGGRTIGAWEGREEGGAEGEGVVDMMNIVVEVCCVELTSF